MFKDLLGECCELSQRAGKIIREIAESGRELETTSKNAQYFDPQTVADRKAQQLIVSSLREKWPFLTIVAEEQDLEEEKKTNSHSPSAERKISLANLQLPVELCEKIEQVDDDLIIWVDPLDGTKQFTLGNYTDVSVLIGISLHSRPIAGIIHEPFRGEHGETTLGVVDLGVFTACTFDAHCEFLPFQRVVCNDKKYKTTVASSLTPCPDVELLLMALPQPLQHVTAGATGASILKVLRGEADLYLRLRNGTSRWDTCAGEALLMALASQCLHHDGELCDKYGGYYTYEDDLDHYDNANGIIACLDSELKNQVLEIVGTMDISRNLNGQSFDVDWLSTLLQENNSKYADDCTNKMSVQSFRVRCDSVRRGRHSHSGVIDVIFDDVEENKCSCSICEQQLLTSKSFFVKRIFLNELPPRIPSKWARDFYSYRTEAMFYLHFYPLLHSETNLSFAKPHAVLSSLPVQDEDDDDENENENEDFEGNDEIDGVMEEELEEHGEQEGFILLLENLEEFDCGQENVRSNPSSPAYFQHSVLETIETNIALDYLSTLHAFGFGKETLLHEVKQKLWPQGGWFGLHKRGLKEVQNSFDIWERFMDQFIDLDEAFLFQQPSVRNLAKRMVENAEYISNCIHIEGYENNTLIHGDFKTANLFFSVPTQSACMKDRNSNLIVIDWQWSGVGVPAMDVAYLLQTSVSIEALRNEDELLAYYYQQLTSKSPEIEKKLSFAQFVRQYELCALEYARMAISYFWSSTSDLNMEIEENEEKSKKNKTIMNRGLAYRSVSHAVRLVQKMDQFLSNVEKERFHQ